MEVFNTKPGQKKSPNKKPPGIQTKGQLKVLKAVVSIPPREMQKGTKRSLRNDSSPSQPDASGFSDEYRALRRKYLLLEEESATVGRNLAEAEREVKDLEEVKSTLLDKLVVLEGLIDPSELLDPSER